jgi:alkanesulfonate monooxygenase SsuD/methylene tetrahydromethanopterin reductase-like flavin-dependent oxidoreductase (luciferase family)
MFEPLDFDSIWTVEHHFTPYTMVPDAIQFLTFMAGRTRRVGFGTMVVVLPWHDPVRVAEQFSLLNNMAQGRSITLGLGRGAGRVEFDGFRIPMGEARERFAEAAEVLRLALSQKRFSFSGKYYQIPEMSIRPQPFSKDLTNHMYGAIVSPETGDIMAKAGIGMLIIPQKPWNEHHKDLLAYQASCTKAGFVAKRPKAGCWVYCAETESEARERGEIWLKNYADSALRHYEYDEPTHFKNAKGYEYHAAMAEAAQKAGGFTDTFADTQVMGTPERCIEVLRKIRSTIDASEFVGVFKYGGMPLEEAQRNLRLFASKVLPVIQADEIGAEHGATAAAR